MILRIRGKKGKERKERKGINEGRKERNEERKGMKKGMKERNEGRKEGGNYYIRQEHNYTIQEIFKQNSICAESIWK